MEGLDAIKDIVRSRRNAVEEKKEQLLAENEEVNALEALLQLAQDLQRENIAQKKTIEEQTATIEKQTTQIERLTEERDALKSESKELKMQTAELSKMTTKVVEKAEHEDLIKSLRKYMKISRRKNVKKRGYIKMVILELCQNIGLTLPDDMQDDLEIFDDDEPKVIQTEKIEVGEAQIERNEAAITIKEQYNYDGIYQPELRGNQNRQAIERVG